MDSIERWKLADSLNVYQIVLLISGYDPSEFLDPYDNWGEEVRRVVSPFMNAIMNAALNGSFDSPDFDYNGCDEIDWNRSIISIHRLIFWMRSRNYADGFFIEKPKVVDRMSNKLDQFYAPKLLAAVRAWTEVTADPKATKGKTPKKALETWLRKNANEYGLTKKDGNPNELGIQEICKVANWQLSGGASPTSTPLAAQVPLEPVLGRTVRPRPPTPSKKEKLSEG